MELFNSTPFRFGPIPSRLGYPGHALTLIVKATFDIVPNGVVEAAEEQEFLAGGILFDDDEEGTGAPRYPSDFAPMKQRADIGFAGRCHAPGGAPVAHCRASIRVGEFHRELVVFGDRRWESAFLGGKPTEPTPFSEMELRFERVLGGPKHKPNPIGCGHRPNDGDPLPNIAWSDECADLPEPAGFGPIGAEWDARRKKLGTYNKKWLRTRWPWFPEDFDPTWFQTASPAMQSREHLKGDEVVILENLIAGRERLSTKLPGLRVRCLIEQSTGEGEPAELREIEMALDTLFVDGDAEKVMLVWRGHTAVVDEDYEDVGRVFLAAESLDAPRSTAEACRDAVLAALAEPEEPEEEATATEEPAPAPPEPKPELVPEDPKIAKIEADIAAFKKQQGLDEDGVPEMGVEDRKQMARLLTVTGMPVEGILAAGVKPEELPPDTAEEKAAQAALREKYSIPEPLPEAEPDPEPEPPRHTRESVIAALQEGASLDGQDLSGLDLSEFDFRQATLEGVNLSGVDLHGALLSGCTFVDVDLSRANLSGARMQSATLAGANLGECDLSRADLSGSDLSGADLAMARLVDATLTGAILVEVNLERATFERSQAVDVDLSRARLGHAVFTASQLEGADFSGAQLDDAVFRDCSMLDVSMLGATGERLVIESSDLSGLRASEGAAFPGAKFRALRADGAIFEAANLDGANFAGTSLIDSIFTRASLVEADFSSAVLKSARFRKADLSRARLVGANLFEASFEKADLTGADARHANLYSAEFLDARLEDLRTDGANLAMTKLA